MTKAVCYARYSSLNQREESIEAQMDFIYNYAEKNGITIIKEYIDRALSGRRADERKAFLDMVQDAKKGLFDIILVHKTNRFARNKEESGYFKYKLKKYGVKVIFVGQDFGEGKHSIILEAVMEAIDEYQSLDLAEETMKGLRKNAEKSLYTGGRVLYGYKVVDKKYEIESQEAAVVKDIFQKVADGWSYIEILRYLSEKGIRNRQGKEFGKNSIHDMLRNERYSGVFVFNRHPRRHPVTDKRTSRITKPDEDIIRVSGGIPAVVSREIWEKVQKILDNRKFSNKATPRKRKFLLTGFITCGLCNSSYVGTTSKTKYTTKGYYSCTKRKNKLTCNNKNISQQETELAVMEDIQSIISSISVPDLTKALNEFYAQASTEGKSEIKTLEKELSTLDKKIDNLLGVIELDGANDIIRKRLQENIKRKKFVEVQLTELKRPAVTISEDFVKRILNSLSMESKTEAELRTVFFKLGLQIIVYPDRVETLFGEKNNSAHSFGVREGTRSICALFAEIINNFI